MKFCLFFVSIVSSLFFTISCSDDPPTAPDQPITIIADSSDNLVTNIQNFYGGTGWDWGTALQKSADNGFIITGSTDSYGQGKNTLYLVKTDSTGKKIWDKIYGGTGEDNGEQIVIADNGNYTIAGVTSSFTSSYDFYLLQVDPDGDIVWEKSIGVDTLFEWGTDMVKLSDGYALCGYQIPAGGTDGGDFYMVRTNLSGDTLWTKTFNYPDREWAFAITATSDNGFVLAGLKHYDGLNNVDAFIIKTDDTGKVLWEETYGGGGNEHLYGIEETNDGNYAACGSTRSMGIGNEELPYILKVDQTGTMLWEKAYGTSGNLHFRDMVENINGHLILTGTLTSAKTGIVKTDFSGNLLWYDSLGLSGNGMAIIQLQDSMYAVTGFARDSIVSGETDLLLMSIRER